MLNLIGSGVKDGGGGHLMVPSVEQIRRVLRLAAEVLGREEAVGIWVFKDHVLI